MKSSVRTAGLVALVGTIIGVGVYGCKKEEPQKQDTSPTVSVEQEPAREYTPPKEPASLEEKLYKQIKIVFDSLRERNEEIYVMTADGSEQRNLTNNPAITREKWLLVLGLILILPYTVEVIKKKVIKNATNS